MFAFCRPSLEIQGHSLSVMGLRFQWYVGFYVVGLLAPRLLVLNSSFPFSKTSCFTKAKEPSLSYKALSDIRYLYTHIKSRVKTDNQSNDILVDNAKAVVLDRPFSSLAIVGCQRQEILSIYLVECNVWIHAYLR